MNIDNIKLSQYELMKKEKAVVARICSDDEFAYYFFHEKCRPLFSKILWTIFGNNSDYDELVNEQHIAAIEHRPALKVELENLPEKTLGYQSAPEHKIVLNSIYVGSSAPNIHKEVINTIIHEGRHAYQHYNVDVKCIHESGAEVETWRENFYDSQYLYYRSTGQRIVIPYNDGSLHDVDFRLYYYQPVEIDARNFAGDVMTMLDGRCIFA